MSQNLRLTAANIINAVTEGRSLSDCLESTLSNLKDSRDRAFVQAICYGVCRFYSRLDFVLSRLLEKPMKAKDSDVHALILVGLYQLMDMRVAQYAAVDETVNATEKLKKPWARGLVNAVLREYLRRKEQIEAEIPEDEEAQYAHPYWLIDALKEAWPNQWEAILAANNEHPAFALRVNQRHLNRDDYLKKLAEKNISAAPISETQHGIVLEEAVAVDELPGFKKGDISVQDGAAQLAAELMMLEPHQHVLDACAAPGGKLMHILEIEPTANCVAVEKDRNRILSIKDNLARLGFDAKIIHADANDTDTWWDGELFDRILLDAPCSASGVIRRHPDIKLLREDDDIPALAEEQFMLLDALWSLLKPGGILLYATCSIFPEENVEVIKQFLADHADAKEEKIVADWGIACEVGRQILPGMHGMDGFYYARLRK